MGKKTISLDYGDYNNFGYATKQTTLELKWEAPDDLEEKFVKLFDAKVAKALDRIETELSSGANAAKKWLSDMDKKLDDVFARWQKFGMVSKKEADFCDELQKMLPDAIENLEKQRTKIFEDMLGKVLDDALAALAAKLKLKIKTAKVKKVLKIVAFAAIALTVTALAIAATVVTFGVAAGPIIAAVGVGLGAISTTAGFVVRTRSIWKQGKDEAKSLTNAARAFADAAAAFDVVLQRQTSQVSLKSAELKLLDKKIQEAITSIETLNRLKANLGPGMQKKIDEAEKARKALEKAKDELAADLKDQEKLLSEALNKKSFEAATAFAKTLDGGNDALDKISEHVGNVSNILSAISGVIPAN